MNCPNEDTSSAESSEASGSSETSGSSESESSEVAEGNVLLNHNPFDKQYTFLIHLFFFLGKQFCEPGKRFKQDCNLCLCSEDGATAACTLKACPKDAVARSTGKYF